jgi:hypothetical protein
MSNGEASQPVTAFVSWSHDATELESSDSEWRDDVVEFTTLLRTEGGIDADVDAYHLSDTDIDWTRFGPLRIQQSDYVLVVVNRAWKERWEGTNDPTTGAGAAAEANALLSLFATDQAEFRRKVKLVLLPGVGDDVVPTGLHGVARFRLDELSAGSLEDLIRTLTGQPRYIRPDVGALPIFPPVPLGSAETGSSHGDLARDVQQIDEQLGVLKHQLERLPEPQPGEGPHLPWWRAWHQAQSRIAELESQRDRLVGAIQATQIIGVGADNAEAEVIRVDAEYLDYGKGRGKLIFTNNSSVALHDFEFDLPPEAGTSFFVAGESVSMLPVGRSVGFVTSRSFGTGASSFEIPITARMEDGRTVTTKAWVSLT